MTARAPGARGVFTIPAGLPFVDALAAGILADAGGAPEDLTTVTLLLPTRRAVRALSDAFLRAGGGRPMLLPRMLPLGDLDEDELAIAGTDELAAGGGDIPPALSGLARQLLLTRLVRATDHAGTSPDQAARLAVELARLLDQMATERLSFEGLADLVPEEYAGHWQQTLKFLRILTERWPEILKEKGCVDPATRRNLLLEAQAARWLARPPDGWVIAAGSTGTIPATADLLACVAGLERGAVVLPGLDTELAADALDRLEPTHPQFAMIQLLKRLALPPKEVAPWPAPGIDGSHPARSRLMADALSPAAETHRWRDLADPPEAALLGITRVDCPGPEEEAGVIALMMRENLDQEDTMTGRPLTAALVTPDQGLARRVAAELRRWGVEVDNSAGTPLALTPPGVFLRLCIIAVSEGFAPAALLALFKHPLAAGGEARAAFRARTRALELAVLRGPRSAAGLDGLIRVLGEKEAALGRWLAPIRDMAHPLVDLLAAEETDLSRLLDAHVAFAEALAADEAGDGPRRLWAEDAGTAAAGFVSELKEAAAHLGPIPGHSYGALLDQLMAARVVRPAHGRHPRLFIWGLLEARLQHADLMILGGLNEGTWPPEAANDPWMSRPMRADFGLPAAERRIGLTAHDFAQAASAPQVVLTRSLRVEGTPTQPSRWLSRLDKFLLEREVGEQLLLPAEWPHWQAELDKPERPLELPRPAPRPPVAARPRRLSVTQIEQWMRDPYAIYARHILGLKALDPLDAAPDAAEYGSLIHDALDAFLAEHGDRLPEDAEARLLEIGRRRFAGVMDLPGVWAFWWPRFARIAAWFAARERAERAGLAAVASEVEGKLELLGPAGPFLLTAKADRVDRLEGGGLRLVDYKTGSPPSKKEVAAGFAPQLPLEAAIAEAGGFQGIAAAPVLALDYWRLRGGDPAGEVSPAGDDPGELARAARQGILDLIARFDDAETAYEARPRPDMAPRYSDYEHLARVKEWSAGGKEDDA